MAHFSNRTFVVVLLIALAINQGVLGRSKLFIYLFFGHQMVKTFQWVVRFTAIHVTAVWVNGPIWKKLS